MALVTWIFWIAVATCVATVLARRSRAYFEAMGKTREARQALYDDVDRIVHPVFARLPEEDLEGLRTIFVECIPLIAREMMRHRLIPVPDAVLYLLARSWERRPRVLRRNRRAVHHVLCSLDPELQEMVIATTSAMN